MAAVVLGKWESKEIDLTRVGGAYAGLCKVHMDFEAPSVTPRVSCTEVSPYGKRFAGLDN